MNATQEKLRSVQDRIESMPIGDFNTLAILLAQRSELVRALDPSPESIAILNAIMESSRQMQIRVQAERRRLCLDAAELRNRQRLLQAMQGTS